MNQPAYLQSVVLVAWYPRLKTCGCDIGCQSTTASQQEYGKIYSTLYMHIILYKYIFIYTNIYVLCPFMSPPATPTFTPYNISMSNVPLGVFGKGSPGCGEQPWRTGADAGLGPKVSYDRLLVRNRPVKFRV